MVKGLSALFTYLDGIRFGRDGARESKRDSWSVNRDRSQPVAIVWFFFFVVVVDKNMSAMHRYVHTFFSVDWGGRFLVELRCHLNDEAMRDAFRREILECL